MMSDRTGVQAQLVVNSLYLILFHLNILICLNAVGNQWDVSCSTIVCMTYAVFGSQKQPAVLGVHHKAGYRGGAVGVLDTPTPRRVMAVFL